MNLPLAKIIDPNARNAVDTLAKAVEKQNDLFGSFKFYEITVSSAVTNRELVHNLGFTPKDVIVTNGASGVTFHFSSFTSTSVYFTTTGAVVIRCFIGRV